MSQTDWEGEAKKLGFSSEREMWTSLYPSHSLTRLAEKFGKGINTIRGRLDKYQIPMQARGGPNNTKVQLDQALIDDVINLGVKKAAEKRGVQPQTIYHRLYYNHGLTVSGLKAKLAAQREAGQPSSTDHPTEQNVPQEEGHTVPKATDD